MAGQIGPIQTASLAQPGEARRTPPPLTRGISFSEKYPDIAPDLANLDFEYLQKANLPKGSFLLILLPVIGWSILVYLHISRKNYHEKAQEIIATCRPDRTPSENLKIALRAKEAAGPLAWQYQFDLAKFYLMQRDIPSDGRALKELSAAMEIRGSSSRSVPNETRFDLKSPNVNSENILIMKTCSLAEAQLAAAVYLANSQPIAAFDYYNEAKVWSVKAGNRPGAFRDQQLAIATELSENYDPSNRQDKRIKAIIEAMGLTIKHKAISTT